MPVSRRTLWLGIALVVALVTAAVVWTSGGAGRAVGGTAANRNPARTPSPAGSANNEPPPHVQLDALKVERATPGDADRNPFRFEARAPSAPPGLFEPKPFNQAAPEPMLPQVPTGPPPPPPIPLKFIGIVEQGGKRVAVLSDGRSTPSGTEGTIILGQYRILKIGNESIEMSYLDGRGRQTIRLTGQ
jgi:hypothetical protein